MRRVLLILMIALLPVRGWAADNMGLVMAVAGVSAQQSTVPAMSDAGPATSAGAQKFWGMAADCPMRVSPAADGDQSASNTGCTTCQLCMAVFTSQAFTFIGTTLLPQAPPGLGSTLFSSAERVAGFKPPIS
ncbi:MAG: hypothetical protein H7293_00035 [Candidatus Saccharibacteria bacterium]|nr:hypothetical protein [Rhodoferax sp.]